MIEDIKNLPEESGIYKMNKITKIIKILSNREDFF